MEVQTESIAKAFKLTSSFSLDIVGNPTKKLPELTIITENIADIIKNYYDLASQTDDIVIQAEVPEISCEIEEIPLIEIVNIHEKSDSSHNEPPEEENIKKVEESLVEEKKEEEVVETKKEEEIPIQPTTLKEEITKLDKSVNTDNKLRWSLPVTLKLNSFPQLNIILKKEKNIGNTQTEQQTYSIDKQVGKNIYVEPIKPKVKKNLPIKQKEETKKEIQIPKIIMVDESVSPMSGCNTPTKEEMPKIQVEAKPRVDILEKKAEPEVKLEV